MSTGRVSDQREKKLLIEMAQVIFLGLIQHREYFAERQYEK